MRLLQVPKMEQADAQQIADEPIYILQYKH
jgi:hypothetical protein